MKVTRQVELVAIKTGKSTSTVWRWAKAGLLDLSNPASIKQFLKGKKRRRYPNDRKPKTEAKTDLESPELAPDLDQIELGPVGKRGAAAALQRLEEIEERTHARLMRAIESGNQFQVKACQEFYLRSSETLRRLDLAAETQRRTALEQIPMRQIEDVSWQISEWLRIAFAAVSEC